MENKLFDWKIKLSLGVAIVSWLLFNIWLVAKMLGYINTPKLLQFLPFITGSATIIAIIASVIGFFVKIGRFLEKFDNIANTILSNTKKINSNTKRMNKIEKSLVRIETNLSTQPL